MSQTVIGSRDATYLAKLYWLASDWHPKIHKLHRSMISTTVSAD
jgi:hypothetical protein